MRAARVPAVLAALLAALPAAAYVRTRGTSGVELAWRTPVVSWHLNRDWPNTSPSCKAEGDPVLDAVQAGFAQWEQPCADLRLLYGGTVSESRVGTVGSSENVVLFRSGWCSELFSNLSPKPECYDDPAVDCGNIYGCFEDHACAQNQPCADKSVVALTSVLYDPASGRIFDADIEINGWDGQPGPLTTNQPQHGWYFTCYPEYPPGAPFAALCKNYGEDNCTFIDLQNTVTHEVGHFIGLAHPCGVIEGRPDCGTNPPAGEVPFNDRTMSPTTKAGDLVKRDLSSDDIAGVCAIYPPADGGCGCGSGGAGSAGALLLAALALRRRRLS